MEEIKSVASKMMDVGADLESYKSLLDFFSLQQNLNQIVNQVLGDGYLKNLIAKRSYNHFNGFYKIILYSSVNYKLRLHIWAPTKNDLHIENIHYHRWSFMSKILLGEYTNYCYEISPHGVLMNKYIYYPRNGSNNYQLVKSGVEKLAQIEQKILRKNSYLISKPYELHRVIPNREVYSASLMLQGKNELDFSLVYNENFIEENIDSPSLTSKELNDVLTYFKQEINAL